ncbi:MFS transporter [Streptomyces sp. NPDC096198]|uniref:MFS transporter n=1 Tax=Streptomyces sp. NPDC096198 TaxID=3366080 RepID=UPI00380C60BB
MLLIDVTIVNVALPQISRSLDASMTSLQWIIDAYALALAALLLVAGSAADLLGRRKIYLLGTGVFAAASLACGLAPTDLALVAGRAVQGVGGAAMFATTTALLTATYRGHDRAIAFSAWGAVSGCAAAAGPTLGGILSQVWGWQAVFLVNLPVAAVTLFLAARVLPETRRESPRRFDLAGAVLFTVAAGCLVAGLISSTDHGWTSPLVVSLLAAGALCLALFVVVESRIRHPLFDVRLLKRPAFAGLMIAALVLQLATFAHLGYTSVWLQSVLGMSPLAAGFVVTPLSLSSLLVASFAGRRLHHLPARIPVTGGLLLIGIGVLTQTAVDASSDWTVLLAGLVVSGLGAGMLIAPLVSAAMEAAPPEDAGTAGAAVNTFRQLGHALGVAVLGAVFVHGASASLTSGGWRGDAHRTAIDLGAGQAPRLMASVPPGRRASVGDLIADAYASGLSHVFLTAGLLALAAAAAAWFLIKRPHSARIPHQAHTPAAASVQPVGRSADL